MQTPTPTAGRREPRQSFEPASTPFRTRQGIVDLDRVEAIVNARAPLRGRSRAVIHQAEVMVEAENVKDGLGRFLIATSICGSAISAGYRAPAGAIRVLTECWDCMTVLDEATR